MTSFMALDGVSSFLRLKDVTNTCKRMRRGLSIGGSSSVQRRKVGRSWRLQICFRRLLCIKIEIYQLQCVICCVLRIYDMIISHALEKQNQNGKNNKELIYTGKRAQASEYDNILTGHVSALSQWNSVFFLSYIIILYAVCVMSLPETIHVVISAA